MNWVKSEPKLGEERLHETHDAILIAGLRARRAEREELGESGREILEKQFFVCRVFLHHLAEVLGKTKQNKTARNQKAKSIQDS